MSRESDPFGILEEKINQLASAYDSMKNERMALDEKMARQAQEIRGLEEKIAHLSREREAARQKVENLLNRLDRLIPSVS